MKLKQLLPVLFLAHLTFTVASFAESRPNIFIAISDDQSWPHASAYGSKMVSTPNFDQIARQGVLFNQAFCASPGCSPSRAAILMGLNTWQLEHAGTHASYFDPKYETFPDRLEKAGYHVGYTGKGWGPGNFTKLGRTQNPAGKNYDHGGKKTAKYVGAFETFLEARTDDKPFCFWFGSHDPHRAYAAGSGLKKGKTLEQAEVPAFLPDRPEIRSDLLDYSFEVERFDDHLGQMLAIMKAKGLDQNTLVIVTSDNGMPFPRAKANCYEYGIHMPLAISWPKNPVKNRQIDDLVSFTDLTATIYDVTGVTPPEQTSLSGKSIRNLLESEKSGKIDESRTAVYSARERHSSSRYNSLSYPQRCIRTQQYLLIRNFRPERWPAGPSRKYNRATFDASGNLLSSTLGPEGAAYHDIDTCPSLTLLIKTPELKHYLDLAVAKRPAIELFDIQKDPGCLENLADNPTFATTRDQLDNQLLTYLKSTGDRRAIDGGDVWETYPRVSSIRWFPEPDWLPTKPAPDQPWLDARKPK